MARARRRDTVERRRMRQAVIAAVLLHLCLLLVVEFVPFSEHAGQGGDHRLTVVMEPPVAGSGSGDGPRASRSGENVLHIEQAPAEQSSAERETVAKAAPPQTAAADATSGKPARAQSGTGDSERLARSEAESSESSSSAGTGLPDHSLDSMAGAGDPDGPLTEGSAVDALVEDIYRRLQDNLVYPMAARRRNVQGIVIVRIQVEPDGSLGSREVEGSSGYSMLDRAALDSLERIFPISHRAGGPVAITVRIEYSLT
ncbi:MAG: TonB family protein [Spirochaetaceae bacterium]|nr:MAG: TonB family protein [Spirochaetaceae bacterium]